MFLAAFKVAISFTSGDPQQGRNDRASRHSTYLAASEQTQKAHYEDASKPATQVSAASHNSDFMDDVMQAMVTLTMMMPGKAYQILRMIQRGSFTLSQCGFPTALLQAWGAW